MPSAIAMCRGLLSLATMTNPRSPCVNPVAAKQNTRRAGDRGPSQRSAGDIRTVQNSFVTRQVDEGLVIRGANIRRAVTGEPATRQGNKGFGVGPNICTLRVG